MIAGRFARVLVLYIAVACGGGSGDSEPGAELKNPVAGSEQDTDLVGTDADEDGIRDDLSDYIASLEADPDKRDTLSAFARASTTMMLLGGDSEPSQDAAVENHTQVARAIDCLASLYEPDERTELVDNIGYALYNNAARLRAYHAADALLNGMILPSSAPCDPDAIGLPTAQAARRAAAHSRRPLTARAAPSDPICGFGTAVYWGNGVNVDAVAGEAVVRDVLPGLADEAGIQEPRRFDLAYNQSNGLILDVIQTLEQKAVEDSRFSWFYINNALGYLLRGASVPTRILDKIPGGADTIALLQEIINAAIADSAAQRGTFYDSDVGRHVAQYRAEIESGYRVLLVAHSQGTLYANAARAQLTLLEGGPILHFGAAHVGNAAEIAPDGYVTSSNDIVIGLLRSLGRTVPRPNVTIPITLDDVTGHFFAATYSDPDRPGRAKVVALMRDIAERIQPSGECPTAGSVQSVSVGLYHACILLQDGSVQCWGSNYGYALGAGAGIARYLSAPVAIEGLAGPAVAISAGLHFTCALLEGGTVQCWGHGLRGKLGNGQFYSSATPVTVTGLTDATAVAVGGYHACALRSGGTVVCWGSNHVGALGTGSTTSPTQSAVPVPVVDLTDVSAISVNANANGPEHTCAIHAGGQVACWGYNLFGQLGNGASFEGHPNYGFPPSGTPVQAIGVEGATYLSTGNSIYPNTCAVVDGAVQCWGIIRYDRLNSAERASPIPVSVPGLADVTQIDGGTTFQCALAGGQVYCWGVNGAGQLGDGTTDLSVVPVPVGGDGIGDAIEVSAGYRYACALRSTGDVVCWGIL